jgi:hypothetical protein
VVRLTNTKAPIAAFALIGSIAPQAAGTSDADAAGAELVDGAAEAGGVSDGSVDPTVTAYLIEETIANAFGAPGAGPGPSCAAMIQVSVTSRARSGGPS